MNKKSSLIERIKIILRGKGIIVVNILAAVLSAASVQFSIQEVQRVEELNLLDLWNVLILLAFIVVNGVFIKQVHKFVKGLHSEMQVVKEMALAFLTGFSNILLFAIVYFIHGIDSGLLDEATKQVIPVKEFSTSLYFSIVTWTTLGYGDLKPLEDFRLLAAVEALMGYVYMAILVGLFLSLIKIELKEKT